MKSWICLSVVAVSLFSLVSSSPEPPLSGYGAPGIASQEHYHGAPAIVSHEHYHEAPAIVAHEHYHQVAVPVLKAVVPVSGHYVTEHVKEPRGRPSRGRFLNIRIPIPRLPKIRFHASIGHGWGWKK